MYGLPTNFDGKFLVGLTLEQICFNQNQVALHFDNDVSIVVESAFSHEGYQSASPAQPLDVPVASSDLMQLLGCSISNASGDKAGTLTLVFDNGHALKCFDTAREYESYRIEHGGKVVIV
jgi:hypothetical protein